MTDHSKARSDYHGLMMNTHAPPASMIVGNVSSYLEGHRDARHAAAEIALGVDREIEALVAEVETLRANLNPTREKIAALVKPLIWGKHPAGIISSTGQGTSYIVDGRNFRPRFIKWPGGSFAPDVGSLVEAKSAAQADHTARILSALNLPTPEGEQP